MLRIFEKHGPTTWLGDGAYFSELGAILSGLYVSSYEWESVRMTVQFVHDFQGSTIS